MKLLTCVLSGLALAIAGSASAQDKMYKKNGDIVNSKITEVTNRSVSYKRADNPDGPVYSINKAELQRIEYQNGTEDVFFEPTEKPMASKQNTKKYGNNIIAIAPLQLNEGAGFGLSYERVLDKNGIMSFYLPATVSFDNNNFSSNTYPYTSSNNKTNLIYYFMPGIKFYPTGSKGVVRYAVGPSISVMTGNREVNKFTYDNMGNVTGQYVGNVNRFSLGVIINNSLNICPTPHLYLGLELGLGVTYIDQEGGKNTGNTNTIGQFGFKIGYRF